MTSYAQNEPNAWDLVPDSELAEYHRAMDALYKVKVAYEPLVASFLMEKTKFEKAQKVKMDWKVQKAKMDELNKLYAEYQNQIVWIMQFEYNHTLPTCLTGPPLVAPISYVN